MNELNTVTVISAWYLMMSGRYDVGELFEAILLSILVLFYVIKLKLSSGLSGDKGPV